MVTYERIYQQWYATDEPWGGCANRGNLERVIRLLDEAWREGFKDGAGRPPFPPDSPYYRG